MRVNRGAPQIREKREKCFVHERGSRQLGWSVASQNALVHTNAKKNNLKNVQIYGLFECQNNI